MSIEMHDHSKEKTKIDVDGSTVHKSKKSRNIVKKEVWPKIVFKRLSLKHPYQCTRCKENFHKIHEATAHYISSHQNSNDLPKKEILENEIKNEINIMYD